MAEKYNDITCYDLTYGFLLGIENGSVEDTRHAILEDATDLDYDAIMALRRSEVDDIYNIIMRLTYPELFDADGNAVEQEPEEETEDKKKV